MRTTGSSPKPRPRRERFSIGSVHLIRVPRVVLAPCPAGAKAHGASTTRGTRHDRTKSARTVAALFPAALALALGFAGPAAPDEINIVVGAAVAPAPASAQVPATAPEPTNGPVLHLSNGGFATGTLRDSPAPRTLRWQAPAFSTPFDFAATGVGAVYWPAPPRLPEPEGDWAFELAGGDALFGGLIALDDEAAELETTRLGRLRIARAGLLRIVRRRGNAGTIYSGPNGLAAWVRSSNDSWREESGQPLTDQAGANLHADLGLPERAAVEFELSWKTKADFALALGVVDDASVRRGFRFEVWDGDLVVNRETDTTADLALLRKLPDGPGRVRLTAYLDQKAGRILVAAPDGTPMADLTVPNPKARPLGGIDLTNVGGDVRLERLRITRWDGAPPPLAEADRPRIHRGDGSIAYGRIARFDADAREFVLRDEEGGESRVAREQAADVFLSAPANNEALRATVRASYADGTRLGGTLQQAEAGALLLAVPEIREPVRLPLEGLRSLVTLHPEAAPKPESGPHGVLELNGARLPGQMANGRGGDSLSWKPDGSASAAPVLPSVSGRIDYKKKDPTPPEPTPPPIPPRMQVGIFGALKDAADRFAAGAPARLAAGRLALHLRTGDVIPCEVTAIDEQGVRFKTELTPSTSVPHAKIKAVELAPLSPGAIKLGKTKRERMLTLPRMQKDTPPTQLIRSVNGDYLRGRIVAMDGATLQVETRLETKAVPRDRVARIIWFHADERETPRDKDKDKVNDKDKKPAAGPPRVQAVRGDGIRLTFRPESCVDGVLSGDADVLGACQVRLAEVDQLLIGGAIEQAASQLVYGRWTLHDAEEPKFVKAVGTGSGAPSGTESALVGKAAPDFELALLGGKKKFHLAECKGQVVVLDFWATWCGPCLLAMPQVERAAGAFRDRGVRLVAVNMQESAPEITAMLERHKLDVAVALDVDGVVGDRYEATAIPQTVIIDRDGKVARLFVGGGPGLEDSLREALKALTDPAPLAPGPGSGK